jgi:hypothetical protein
VTLTDHEGKDWTFSMGDAKVRLNGKDSKRLSGKFSLENKEFTSIG